MKPATHIDEKYPVDQAEKGKPKIGFWISTSLVVGNMTGSGIFLLPAALALYGGISIFGWLFTAVGSMFLALVFSRLSRIISRAGGPYAFARAGFGDFAGFVVIWGYWVSIWCGNAAIAVAGTGYLSVFIPALREGQLFQALVAVGAIWIFTLVNTRNIRSVGVVQLITTLLKVVPLLLLGTIGFTGFQRDHFIPLNLSAEPGFSAVTATAALTLWAFLGLESATIPADKVINPGKTIPRATMAGLLLTALLFTASTAAIMGIIHPADLEHSAAPFADAAGRLWGVTASRLVAAGAAIACFGALNGWILLQGQIPMAAAADRLFPPVFKKVNNRGIPLAGLVIASVMSTLLVGMNYSRGLVSMFSFMIMLSTLTCLLPYLFSSLAELMLYARKKEGYTTARLVAAMAVGIPAFAYSVWAVTGLGLEISLWGVALLAAGTPFYFWLRRYSAR